VICIMIGSILSDAALIKYIKLHNSRHILSRTHPPEIMWPTNKFLQVCKLTVQRVYCSEWVMFLWNFSCVVLYNFFGVCSP